MHVKLIDPSAFTPPYDRSLAAALAAEGAEVELITSEFTYGPVPEPEGYDVSLEFYRHTPARGRRLAKAVQHLPQMRRLKRRIDANPEPLITHYQWLTMPRIDHHLISSRRPRVMTAHYILPPGPTPRQLSDAKSVFGGMDAVIAHSNRGAERLISEVGLPAERVRVIPHGAFDYLTRLPEEAPLPPELGSENPAWEKPGDRPPVIVFFGLLRPYKGIDVLIRAAEQLAAPTGKLAPELWIVGNARMDLTELMERTAKLRLDVRWLPRFIEDSEIPAIMRRADVLVLPYLDGEQSGVLYTGIAFGKAMVVSDVGGIGEVAREHGVARLVEPGDADSLGAELSRLTVGPDAAGRRRNLEESCQAAAAGPFAWSGIARQTMDLYRELLP